MSVLYRALWADKSQDDAEAYLAKVRERFVAWATESEHPAELDDGEAKVVLRDGRTRTVGLRSVDETDGDSHVLGIEGVAQDGAIDTDDGTTWTTLVRVISNRETVRVWVENRVESDDLSLRVSVGRPRLVDDLLAIPGKPVLGGSELFTDTLTIPAEHVSALVEMLRSPKRKLPVIVCSEPGAESDGRWQIRAERIARRAGGIALVITLSSDAVTAFRRELGDLAIWGGGVRVYAPTPVDDSSEGWRHRYTLGRVMEARESAMVDRIVFSVAMMSARRRVPDEFKVFTSTAPAESGPNSPAGFLSEEDAERERDHWERLLDDQVSATNDAERELAQKIGHLGRMKAALEGEGLHHLYYGTQHEEQAGVPDSVQDTSEAILAAQTYLTDWLVVHDSAGRELDGIDTGPSAFAWGNTTWRGFRALAAYAEARAGGFSSASTSGANRGLRWAGRQRPRSCR